MKKILYIILLLTLLISFSNISFASKIIDKKEYIEVLKEMQNSGEIKSNVDVDKILTKIQELQDKNILKNQNTKKNKKKLLKKLIFTQFSKKNTSISKKDDINNIYKGILDSHSKRKWNKKDYQYIINELNILSANEKRKIGFSKLNELLKKDNDVVDEIKVTLKIAKIISGYKKEKIKNEYIVKSISLNPKYRSEILDIILEIYPKASKKEKEILDYYFKGTISGLSDEYGEKYSNKMLKKFINLKNEVNFNILKYPTYKTRNSYNVNNAISYAENHYNNYNDEYPDLNDLDGDCTNFVSQILKVGGHNMDYVPGWYIYKKNSTYIRPINIYQLNYSWYLADPSPWISARKFEFYWSSKVSYNTYYATDFINNFNVMNYNYYEGDTVQILKRKRGFYFGYHTMFIHTYVTNSDGNSDFGMAYHTNDKYREPLKDVVQSFMNSGGKYKVKFYDTLD